MDGKGIGEQLGAVVKLAEAGITAMAVLGIIGILGLTGGFIWLMYWCLH